MGMLRLFFVILVAGAYVAVAQQQPFHASRNAVLSVDILPSLPESFDSIPTTVVTVDCLFCSSTDDGEVSSSTWVDTTIYTQIFSIGTEFPEPSEPSGIVSAEASGTVICAPHCQTFVTVPWKSGESKIAPLTPVPVTTSCITIFNTPIPIPLPTIDMWTPVVPSPSLSTSTSCSTTDTDLSPWTWHQPGPSLSTELASKITPTWSFVSVQTSPATEVSASTWKSTSTLTEGVPVSEPCTTEITVTMTKTFYETWESKTLQIVTLSRTISTTIETVIVEAYSTSTGEVVVEGTKTELTTVEAVSSGVDCSEAEKCCAACSVTAESVGVETTTSTLVGTYTTVEEYVSSAGGSWVPAESPSGTAVIPGTEGSTPTNSETLTETTTISGSHAETETAGPTSVQTAGAAHVTAAVGIGAIFGLMGLLA
ncbi:hypothetical protein FOC1_g10007600 [Fusarium oxysporum f. sp. cubense race 1]|uniref:Uncharacterized protein n=1 Tax=Fusarium oxysporum f. sp. cubense (strain race 1) TaxID=1229664 RepID=N4TVR1_FUSC1|nr:hypothetical protein FOC1_g10007600 [Fusarium oxysporum f. sp. cubense race 1]